MILGIFQRFRQWQCRFAPRCEKHRIHEGYQPLGSSLVNKAG